GTGLGLCLSQQIVERHGGEIHLTSEPGRGTLATVDLPEAPAEMEVDPRFRTQEPQGRTTSRTTRIMIVDDDPNVLSPLESYLQKSGFAVRALEGAALALKAADDDSPDLVISDIGMPGMDGIALCRELKKANPSLPIVLMSGQASAI